MSRKTAMTLVSFSSSGTLSRIDRFYIYLWYSVYLTGFFQILRRFETRDYPSEVGENLGILEQIAWRDRIHSQPITERNVMFINALDIFHLLATCVPCTTGNTCNVDDAELQWWEFASFDAKIDGWLLGGTWEEREILSCWSWINGWEQQEIWWGKSAVSSKAIENK